MIYLSEEMAVTKWCPMVRFEIWPDGTIGNNRNKKGDDSMCIASKCMMWCWRIDDKINIGCCGLVDRRP